MFDVFFYTYLCSFLSGVPFPKNYLQVVKKLLTRLYRVFVHVYIHHFDKMVALGAVSINHLKNKLYPHHTWFNIFSFIYIFNIGVYFLRNEIVVNAYCSDILH